MLRRGPTNRQSSISTVTVLMLQIEQPKSRPCGRMASVSSMLTTEAMEVVADATAAYDHLIGLGVPANKIVAYGESLGSGQAVRLATARQVAAVVLEAPLTSTVDVARSTYFWLPLHFVLTDKYNNEHNVRSVATPILILHGEQDTGDGSASLPGR